MHADKMHILYELNVFVKHKVDSNQKLMRTDSHGMVAFPFPQDGLQKFLKKLVLIRKQGGL